jgi:hypothetical protein
MEAGLVLYGNELGLDTDGKEIPIYAMLPAARVTVSFSPLKGEFIGRDALRAQFEEVNAGENDYPIPPKEKQIVPKSIMPFHITGQGIARRGYEVFVEGKVVGHVTSGTMVPYWIFSEAGILGKVTDEKRMRPIGLAYVDSDLEEGQKIEIQSRGKTVQGLIVEKKPFFRGAALCPSSLCFTEACEKARGAKSERPGRGTDAQGGSKHSLEAERILQSDPFGTDPFASGQAFLHDGSFRSIRRTPQI